MIEDLIISFIFTIPVADLPLLICFCMRIHCYCRLGCDFLQPNKVLQKFSTPMSEGHVEGRADPVSLGKKNL